MGSSFAPPPIFANPAEFAGMPGGFSSHTQVGVYLYNCFITNSKYRKTMLEALLMSKRIPGLTWINTTRPPQSLKMAFSLHKMSPSYNRPQLVFRYLILKGVADYVYRLRPRTQSSLKRAINQSVPQRRSIKHLSLKLLKDVFLPAVRAQLMASVPNLKPPTEEP